MLLTDVHRINIYPVFEPPLILSDPHVISTHHPLAHLSILGKRPVFQPIAAPPLPFGINELIPELDRDLESMAM